MGLPESLVNSDGDDSEMQDVGGKSKHSNSNHMHMHTRIQGEAHIRRGMLNLTISKPLNFIHGYSDK